VFRRGTGDQVITIIAGVEFYCGLLPQTKQAFTILDDIADPRKPRYNACVKFTPTFCWLPRGTPTPAGFMNPYASLQQAIPAWMREKIAAEDARIARARNAHLIAILR
jgi:hypothetical protein